MATRRVPVEYILRRVPQEGLEGERTLQDQTISHHYAYMHRATGNECEVAYKSFIACTVVYDTHKSCMQKL